MWKKTIKRFGLFFVGNSRNNRGIDRLQQRWQ